MADGFIVRKGGAVTEQAATPTITEVSKTETEIVFTITNNDASTAVILWEVDDSSPDANSLELATGVTSSNITVDSLEDDTTFIVYATANVTGKIKSEVASESITTDATPVYTAATGGTTEEYDDGGKRYKSHTFTSDDDFEVTTAGNGDRNQVDYLIIAGGGAAGFDFSGGGGAGGYKTTLGTQGGNGTLDTKPTVTATTYGVIVGAGGTAPTTRVVVNGSNSSVAFTGTPTAIGGGGGGAGRVTSIDTNRFGGDGGSGGAGGWIDGVTSNISGGNGTANQGTNGGLTSHISGASIAGGGGGGAGQTGTDASGVTGGEGGDGLANLIRTGSNETRAGGGGGSAVGSGSTNGAGGAGGGGAGDGSSGTVNTGSGGGGLAGGTAPGSGGSGIVIIRYEIAPSV